MKSLIKKLAKNFGFFSIANKLTSNKLNIILYHGFFSKKNFKSFTNVFMKKFISSDEFEKHLRLFIRYATPISLENLFFNSEIPKNALIVTIDDGYENNYSIAYPLLKKYRVPATIFLTTGFIDRNNLLWADWVDFIFYRARKIKKSFNYQGKKIILNLENKKARYLTLERLKKFLKAMPQSYVLHFLNELQDSMQVKYSWDTMPKGLYPLKWEQIREMKKSGLITLGSHTVTHPILSRCKEDDQQYELYESKCRIEKETNEPCYMFAYPNGQINDYKKETIELLKKIKYKVALTAEHGYNHRNKNNLFELKRWGSNIHADRLEIVISGASLYFKKFRKEFFEKTV